MRASFTVIGLLLIGGLVLSGCSSDDDGPAAPTTGSVVITVTPDDIGAGWTLAGPGDFNDQGTGAKTYTALDPGEYTLTWNAVAGWTPPVAETKSLTTGGKITFAGTYTEVVDGGDLLIDTEPNSIQAPWQLSGPNGFSQTGAGDLELSDIATGEYTIIWSPMTGWILPEPATEAKTLAAGGTITFYGAYIEENPTTGSVIIDPEPDSLNASWHLTSPSTDFEGSGDSVQHGKAPGLYTLEWGEVVGWVRPRVQNISLVAGDTITFMGVYTEQDAPPVACMSVDRTEANPDSLFTFDASCSRDQGGLAGPLGFRWDWDSDGVWDHPGGDDYTTGTTASHSYPIVDEYTITMEVRDPAENTDTTTRTVTVVPLTTDRIIIDTDPDLTNAPWSISGPNYFYQEGNGDFVLYDMEAGYYEITWGTVTGWLLTTQATETLELVAGFPITFTSSYLEVGGQVDAVFVPLDAGAFFMGSPQDEPFRNNDEFRHEVHLTHPFEMMDTEVTNQMYIEMAQWAVNEGHATATDYAIYTTLDGSNEQLYQLVDEGAEIDYLDGVFICINPDNPVQNITWYGAAAYCDWLSLRHDPPLPRAYDHSTWICNGHDPYTAEGYRLPTEAEWEYACRAGTTTTFATGTTITDSECSDAHLGEIAWYCENAGERNHEVRTKPGNPWGLHDMHGNTWEWTNAWYDLYAADTIVFNPVGPIGPAGVEGTKKLVRGGSWTHGAQECRSAARYYYDPYYATNTISFRVVRTTE